MMALFRRVAGLYLNGLVQGSAGNVFFFFLLWERRKEMPMETAG